MKNLLILCSVMLLAMPASFAKDGAGKESVLEKNATKFKMPAAYVAHALGIYNDLDLARKGLEKDIFLKAYKGYLMLLSKGLVANPNMLSIADFSQSNINKRLYVVDLRERKLLMQTFVSHGKNSGSEMATSFSNVNNSNKSVLGFLITADTYVGSNGLSLRFHGMEPGINDLVNFRSIVVHGSKYVNEKELAARGEMVNSLGCPAVPMAQSKTIINAIKGGSVYFIYHPDETYAQRSPILNAQLGYTMFLPITNPFNGTDTVAPTSTGIQLSATGLY